VNFAAHRIFHRPVSLSIQVSGLPLPPVSSRSARFASPGCPVLRTLWPCRRPILGLPLVSVLWPCRRSIFELPRISDASALLRRLSSRLPRFLYLCNTSDEFSGCPSSSPPALPAMDHRVASILTSFGGAGVESLESPRFFAFPVSPMTSPRVAPKPASSGTG
jgi:hypothetical protein